MGKPVLIYDLAVKMIKLSGLQVLDENNPDGDIEIQYSGLRPGEKLYEELLVDGNFTFTENKLIMRAEEEMISWDKLEPILTKIKDAAFNSDTEKLYKLLHQLVPEYKPIYNDIDNLEYKEKRKKYKIVK
jgi:FlaA1/EpsC-like NDP-sugar epimerase